MNTEQIKSYIRTIKDMSEPQMTNAGPTKQQCLALWEIALQLSMLNEEIELANKENRQ